MFRFTRATRRTRLLLGIVVAFTLLFMCGVADDNDRGAAVRPTPEVSPSVGGSSDFSAARAAAAAAPDFTASESEVLGGGRSVSVRGESSAAVVVAAVGMVHQEAVEQRQDAAVWQGQAVTVVGLVGLTVFAVIVAVVGRKLYRSRRDRRNGVSSVQQASASLGGGASRSRLFSRDRLNTTDYMHTLATLDRRLAMDEILEKRRRAVFLQQIRCHAPGDEDDVFLEEGLFCPEPSPSRHPAAAAASVDDTSSGRLHQQHSAASLL